MLVRFVYLAVSNPFAALRLLPMSSREKDAEILALRTAPGLVQTRSFWKDRVVMSNRKPYPADLRDRAARLVLETEDQHPSRDAAVKSIAAKLGIGTAQSLRNWVRQAKVDARARPGVSTEETARIKALERENAELRRANEILKAAASFFASAELDRPHRRS